MYDDFILCSHLGAVRSIRRHDEVLAVTISEISVSPPLHFSRCQSVWHSLLPSIIKVVFLHTTCA